MCPIVCQASPVSFFLKLQRLNCVSYCGLLYEGEILTSILCKYAVFLPCVQALLPHKLHNATISLEILVFRQVKPFNSAFMTIPMRLGDPWVM